MSETLLSNENYEIRYHKKHGNNVTIVFSSAGALALAQPIEEFKKTIQNFDTSYIFVWSKHLDWYNNVNSVPMFKFLNDFCKKYQYIYVMGESLGGAGALLFARFCNRIHRILAFSPQYSALPSFCKWYGPLTPLDGAIPHFMFSDYAPEEAQKNSVLIFPSLSYEDNLHARFFKSETFEVIFIDTGHHDIARHLKKDYATDYLNLVMRCFYDDTFEYNHKSFENLLFDIVEKSKKPFSKWIGNQTFPYTCYLEKSKFELVSLNAKANQSSICKYSRYLDTQLEASGGLKGPLTMEPSFHTDCENRPWWSVDLQMVMKIEEIRIFNRCDNEEFSRRFTKFSILISLDGDEWSELYRKTNTEIVGGEYGCPFQLLNQFHARFVKIVLLDYNYLHLSKVEIYSSK